MYTKCKGTKCKGTKCKGTKRKGLKTKKRSIRHRHHTKRTNKVVKRKTMKHKTRKHYTRKHKRRNLRKSKVMRGGMFSDNAGSYPDTYVPGEDSFDSGLRSLGNPYNAAVNGTPSGNHHPYNPYVKDPPIQSNPQQGLPKGSQQGGKKHKQSGGGFLTKLMPEELVNVGRSVPAAFGNLADKFKGDIPHPSSKVYPTEQPHVYSSEDRGNLINPDTISIDDITNIYNNANNEISGI